MPCPPSGAARATSRLLVALAVVLAPPAPAADLAAGFGSPPPEARPRVWWHWMAGNVTRDGIERDLEWMARVGIGGVQNFDAALATPRLVDAPVTYATPAWREAFRHAATTADRLGLELAVAGSPGWSLTGGPWVAPHQAMKKLVWREIAVEGRRPVGRLAAPPSTSGPFQSMIGRRGPFVSPDAAPPPEFYRDIAVLAYPLPASPQLPLPRVSSAAGSLDPAELAALGDGEYDRTVAIAHGSAGGEAWLALDYGRSVTVRAASLALVVPPGPPGAAPPPAATLEVSDDGRRFGTLARIELPAPQNTVAFPPTRGRVYRLRLPTPPPPHPAFFKGRPPRDHQIAEFVLHGTARVHRFEEKAGFAPAEEAGAHPTPPLDARAAIPSARVVDVTRHLRADGRLDWTPPPGRWAVLRLGYSLTGRQNGPAPAAATGLEVDKLDAGHVKSYAEAYLARYEQAVGPALLGRRGLQYLVIDSYEAGAQNWTERMAAQFARRRGYDPTPFLPVLTGRVVGSARTSDRFLWDFRRTLGDLIAEAHYGQLTASAHARGLRRYGESHESHRAFVGDGMEVKKSADVPMGAMWIGRPQAVFDADVKETASVAHIYGQKFVAAEAFTASSNPYGYDPAALKPTADRLLALGLNRFVIHTSVHQPRTVVGPGVGLGPFGQWFTRHETWADLAGAWLGYLSRSSFLLQQGRAVADIAYFYGEDTNITERFGKALPAVPPGYDFDFVSADALVNALDVDGGELTTAGGARYRLLIFDPPGGQVSLPVLRRLDALVRAGAAVVGPRPSASPSLADDDAEFRRLADGLWGDGGVDRAIGRGKVFGRASSAEALAALGCPPDVSGDLSSLRFAHRRAGADDLYFVSNTSDRPAKLELSFRVEGRGAEIWRADTGEVATAAYRGEGARTVVPLDLAAHDAVFVRFTGRAAAPRRDVAAPTVVEARRLTGRWDVTFPPERGGPGRVTLDSLTSWTQHPAPGIRYFSGTATYAREIAVERSWLAARRRIRLELGQVRNLAQVVVNGRPLGTLWKAPFGLDITDALRPGRNRLEVRVTNLWPNRLIGDKQPGATPIASATYDPFTAQSPLLESGILGPVELRLLVAP